MVDSINAARDHTFAALANPTRRDMLVRLASGESTVSDLAKHYDMSLNAVSKHVMQLEQAGLVTRRVDWRTHTISLNPEPLRSAHEWLEFYRRFWEQRLDALEVFLAHNKGAPKDEFRDDTRSPATPKPKTRRKP